MLICILFYQEYYEPLVEVRFLDSNGEETEMPRHLGN
jgi:hypothetical protein